MVQKTKTIQDRLALLSSPERFEHSHYCESKHSCPIEIEVPRWSLSLVLENVRSLIANESYCITATGRLQRAYFLGFFADGDYHQMQRNIVDVLLHDIGSESTG